MTAVYTEETRRLQHVTLATVTIETDSLFTIAAPQAATAADRPAAADAVGNAVVPGSSIAGSLRGHLRSDDLDEPLLGCRSPLAGDDASPTSSVLRIVGTEVSRHDLPVPATELTSRTTVSIDRRRAAARSTLLVSSTAVPAGTRVQVYLRIDRRPEDLVDADGQPLPDLARLLWGWQPVLGGGRTRGEGRAHVVSVAVGTLDLTRRDDLARWLRLHGPELHRDVVVPVDKPSDLAAPADLLLDCRLDIVDPLHVAGAKERNRSLFYVNDGKFAVEGSSLKGVVRSR